MSRRLPSPIGAAWHRLPHVHRARRVPLSGCAGLQARRLPCATVAPAAFGSIRPAGRSLTACSDCQQRGSPRFACVSGNRRFGGIHSFRIRRGSPARPRRRLAGIGRDSRRRKRRRRGCGCSCAGIGSSAACSSCSGSTSSITASRCVAGSSVRRTKPAGSAALPRRDHPLDEALAARLGDQRGERIAADSEAARSRATPQRCRRRHRRLPHTGRPGRARRWRAPPRRPGCATPRPRPARRAGSHPRRPASAISLATKATARLVMPLASLHRDRAILADARIA